MSIVEIKKANVGDQVYQQLRKQILDGEWKPGEKIPSENALIAMMGVSRGTVRQAIQRLAGENLVETRRGEGSFVCTRGLDHYFQTSIPLFEIGKEEMNKIFVFRSIFESGVAEAAALRATEEQIRRLEENYEKMRGETENLEQFVRSDLNFHMLVCECTQNTLVIQVYNSYENLMGPSILRMTEAIGPDNGIKYHGLILDAIRSRDAKRARESMSEHMNSNLNRFIRIF